MSFKFATEASTQEYSYNLVDLGCSAAPEQTTEVTKTCTKCGVVKRLSGFHKHTAGKFGKRAACRTCTAEVKQAWLNNAILTVNERTAPAEKQCPSCKTTKPASGFSRNRTTKDTLCDICKQCTARTSALHHRHLANTADQRVVPVEKQCYMCKETKNASKFGKDRSTYDTLTGNCKKCRTIVGGVWIRNNPDKINAKTARRRASALQRTPPWANKAAIDAVYSAARPDNLHVDHIVPLQGKRVSGLHTEANLQLLTESQNCSKGNRFNPDTYVHHIPQATGTESLALWACLAPHRTQTND